MPLFSESTTSAVKTRFGYHQNQQPEAADSGLALMKSSSTPDLFSKSASRDIFLLQSSCKDKSSKPDDGETTSCPATRSFEFREDPNFWKEHNVQEMLFKVAGLPMVENCVEGYNSCMFAYGQTGSGKTHTMLGDIEGGARRHSVNCGMTPRVFEYLFSRIQKIREDSKKGIYVENVTEVEVSSARDVIQQLIQMVSCSLFRAANRKVAATNMNRASSRSHSVFTCIIEQVGITGVTHHRFARLNLVDLAGSERQKSSGAEGERLKEATNINKLVIMNLVSISNGKSQHVPYRDSKLTFLLQSIVSELDVDYQDSLGGNAKTTIIANISPSSCCSLETLSTLKFAQRAKFIKNHAIVNEDASGDVLALRLENQNLKWVLYSCPEVTAHINNVLEFWISMPLGASDMCPHIELVQ
ncbi:Kinesin-like protein KIN-12E [Sesamum angolense]|uniref:Kinesin-like protein n=1 Tax=Sesamum angolense TaxID=2727404 RepID=A0AAE1XAL0_9LAMI|nr:Kinesin-like protein KIN-12E [Sesamum angolense]